MSRLSQWLWLERQGSTRLFGLLRISFVFLIWATWTTPFILHFDMRQPRLALAVSFFGTSTLLLAGIATRWSAGLLALTLVAASVLLGGGDPDAIWLTQDRQLTTLIAVLVALGPAGASLSVDQLRRARASGVAIERGPLWSQRLAQLCAVGLLLATTAGMLSPSWLSGSAFTQAPDVGPIIAPVLLAGHILGLLGLAWPRSRAMAALLLALFYLLLYPFMFVGTICLAVAWLLSSFLPAEAVHRVIDELQAAD